ncbi:MAG: BCD family MFS transporter [Gemmatimonadales bacterium]|jgi:BCD family chlorophyll transporter-like MFS transporter|nr:BCD family MFS transporter [Gemmatimonadales bacterium]
MRGGFALTAFRLGLVQAAIGAVVVLMTSTLNRVMVVELRLPAAVPGALVALHFAVQFILRPRFGHASDGRRRTGWIVGGLLLLAVSGVGAAASTLLIAQHRPMGLLVALAAFLGIGAGVSAAGTPLLALVAELIPAERRAKGAATVWLMMVAGFIVTTVVASRLLEPFSLVAMVRATAIVSGAAVSVALLALVGLEPDVVPVRDAEAPPAAFRDAVAAVWGDRTARLFTLFILASMLAFSAQDLILEPFAGAVFGLSPAQSTRIASMHQGGMLIGMLACAFLAARIGGLRAWAIGGCAASALAFLLVASAPALGSVPVLRIGVLALGVGNGAFAIGAVGLMMALSVAPGGGGAGVRMGVFGAAQAVAQAVGGFAGAAGSDVARLALGSTAGGYTLVFALEALCFLGAALLAYRGGVGAAVERSPLLASERSDALLAQVG